MLQILLLILKILGLILAWLLGILLFLLLILLFVPFRYRVYAGRKGEWLVRGKVTWLLRIVSFPFVFEKGVFTAKLKVFGLTVKNFTEDEEELEGKEVRFFRDVQEEAEDLAYEEVFGEAERTGGEEIPAVLPQTETDVLRKGPAEKQESKQEEKEPSRTRKKNIFAKFLQKLRSAAQFLKGLSKKIRNLKYTIRRFCVKMKRGIRKVRETKAFLTDERTHAAFRAALREVLLLLKALLPRKIRGEVHFGREDPALTGEILGGIGIFYPVFMDNVKVFPDFEAPVLEGELLIKGRIRLVTVLGIAIRLWMDKNVRYVYRKL